MFWQIFNLSDFKYFFKVEKLCKELGEEKAQQLQRTYSEEQGKDIMSHTYVRSCDYYGTKIEYKVTAQTLHAFTGIYAFLIEWTPPEGRRTKQQLISLTAIKNNAIADSCVHYFLCPHSGRMCRKLYTNGDTIGRRRNFTDRYPSQNRSHKERAIAAFRDAASTDPHKKYGRLTYKGKLTPYGRRVQRWEERVQAAAPFWYESLYNTLVKAGLRPPVRRRRKTRGRKKK